MVAPFGGITAATLIKALLDHPKRQGEPITITVNFASAVKDGAFEIETNLLPTNRSTQHWTVALSQDNEVAVTAVLLFIKKGQRAFKQECPAIACEEMSLPWVCEIGNVPVGRLQSFR